MNHKSIQILNNIIILIAIFWWLILGEMVILMEDLSNGKTGK